MSLVDLATVARHLRETPKPLRYIDRRWNLAHLYDTPEEWLTVRAYLCGAMDALPGCSVLKGDIETLYDIADRHYADAVGALRTAAGWPATKETQ